MAQWSHLLLWATLLECIRLALGNWDYIVVGGGASGCTAASLFAATGKMVVVLEAGEETAWDFGGRAQSASFGMLDSSTVFDVPGENEKLRKTSKNWWQNLPWGLNGKQKKKLNLLSIYPISKSWRSYQNLSMYVRKQICLVML